MPSEKKSILDFCHIIEGRQTVPLQYWLAQRGMEQRRVGLIKIAHARELYALFYDADGTLGYHSIAPKPEATTLSLSSIPEGETPLAIYPSTKTDTAATAANMPLINNGWQNATKHAIKARRRTAKVTMQKI